MYVYCDGDANADNNDNNSDSSNRWTIGLNGGGSYFAEVRNRPIFMAEIGNIVWFQRISDTKTVMETEISYSRGSENGNCQHICHGYRKL